MILRYPLRFFGRIFKNLYFLTFFNGFLLSSLLYFNMEANYERELFAGIKKSIDKKMDTNDTQDSLVIKIMHSCNNLLGNRAAVFIDDEDLEGLKIDYLHPATIDLMTAKGACGSYSLVLARILQNYDFPVRIAQMKAHGRYGAHNVIEAKIHSGWVVLDPTFNVFFTRPDNQLASFADIKNNWNFYRTQLPKGYDSTYRYSDGRYTNWDKIPVILPGIKKILDLFLGKEKADTICVRMFFLKMYDIYFYFTLILFIPILIITVKKIIKTKVFPTYDIPFTPENIIKYIKLRLGNSQLNRGV